MPLKGLPALLPPRLLLLLAEAGHGDELVISDANFPSHSQGLPPDRVVRLDGHDAVAVLTAVLSLLPLDTFQPHQAAVMRPVDPGQAEPAIFAEFQRALDEAHARDGCSATPSVERVERFAFYERVKRKAFAVVVTSEARLYGNIIVPKGVIGSDGKTVEFVPSVQSTSPNKKPRQ